MNHVYLPAVRAECSQTRVGRRMCSLRVAARIRRCKSNPWQAETSFWEFRSCRGKLSAASSWIFAKVDGPPHQFPDMRPTGPLMRSSLACELELRKSASHATLELKGRDFRAGAAEVHFACYFRIEKS